MKLSERILHEAGIADRPGQYERLIQIVYEVEKLEEIVKRVEEAPQAEFLDDGGNMPVLRRHQMGLWNLVGKRVAIVPIDEDTP